MRREISLNINGTLHTATVPDRMLLVQFIRDVVGLKGTHIGCDTGHCGACTVIMDGVAVKSCLILAVQADGSNVMTIEGLSKEGKLDEIQEAFRDEFAVQCGYCTPGFIMLLHSLKLRGVGMSDDDIKDALVGNICRCNGYPLILRAARRILEGDK